jgi:DNA-binding transcriptional MerR regulator
MKSQWSLSEAARLLNQPQHRLIYLCEKRVVVPDLGDARGRGSSRRFSARNLLEFGIALKLRELTVPARSISAILYALRAFEAKVASRREDFDMPAGLLTPNAAGLRIILTDEGRLFFSLHSKAEGEALFGGIEFDRLAASRQTKRRSKIASPRRSGLDFPDFHGRLPEKAAARVEIDVTRIARRLDLHS